MGAAIAALFANAGFEVVLVDRSEEALKKARGRHEGECLEELEEAGLKKRDNIVSTITYTTELSMLKSCEFIVESIFEKLPEKIELFRKIEGINSEATLATNTSSFMPSEIAENLSRPERLTLFHFSNPPILMPLVEVGGSRVSEETLEKAVKMAQSIGKEPVVLRRECRGHVLNRMLAAAGTAVGFCLLYSRPEEIDNAIKNLDMKYGFFETLDLIGLDIARDVLVSFREAYGSRFYGMKAMDYFLEKMLEWGKLGKKSGEGFYRWKGRKAEIPEAAPADITPLLAAIVNEALRTVEDGIADEETVNKVYRLALNAPYGILDVAEVVGYQNLRKSLEEAYAATKLEIFLPCEAMKRKVNFFDV